MSTKQSTECLQRFIWSKKPKYFCRSRAEQAANDAACERNMGNAKTQEDKLVSIRTHPDKTVMLRQGTGPRRYYSEAQTLAAEMPNFSHGKEGTYKDAIRSSRNEEGMLSYIELEHSCEPRLGVQYF